MILGLLLNIGESLTSLKKSGQDRRLIDYYLKNYRQEFSKVYLFSFAKERYKLPKNCRLIINKFKLHSFIYTFLMPLLYFREFKKCEILRVTHLLGSIPAIIAKVFYGKKFIVTYGYDYRKFAKIEGKGYLTPLIVLIEFLAFSLANGVIVTSSESKKYVSKKIEAARVFYIPNGVDVRLFKPNSKLKTQNSKLKVLFVGRLEKQKNLFNLIKAISLLKDKEKVSLEFVGDGSLRESLKQYAQDLKVSLKIRKRIPHNKMPQIYQQVGVFVLPSLIEGHPKVLLEAMSCGLPCIGTQVEGIGGLIKNRETGVLCQTNAESLSKTISLVLKNKNLREKMGQKARKMVVREFDLKVLLKKEAVFLKQLSRQ